MLVPIIFDRFDDKAESRAHAVHVFVHDFLHDGGLSCIVQAPMQSAYIATRQVQRTYNINILISLSFKRAFRRIDSILDVVMPRRGSVKTCFWLLLFWCGDVPRLDLPL